MMKRIPVVIVMALLMSAVALAQGNGNGRGKGNGHGNHGNQSDEGNDGGQYVFSRSDRTRIIDCMTGEGGREGLPPGLAKRDRLPPGLERQLRRNGQLPPGLQKKIQPLPRSCEVRLPRLPSNVTRVVLGNYVILRDIHDRILDLIDLNRR